MWLGNMDVFRQKTLDQTPLNSSPEIVLTVAFKSVLSITGRIYTCILFGKFLLEHTLIHKPLNVTSTKSELCIQTSTLYFWPIREINSEYCSRV